MKLGGTIACETSDYILKIRIQSRSRVYYKGKYHSYEGGVEKEGVDMWENGIHLELLGVAEVCALPSAL